MSICIRYIRIVQCTYMHQAWRSMVALLLLSSPSTFNYHMQQLSEHYYYADYIIWMYHVRLCIVCCVCVCVDRCARARLRWKLNDNEHRHSTEHSRGKAKKKQQQPSSKPRYRSFHVRHFIYSMCTLYIYTYILRTRTCIYRRLIRYSLLPHCSRKTASRGNTK